MIVTMTFLVSRGRIKCADCGRKFTNTRQYRYAFRKGSPAGIVRVCRWHPSRERGSALHEVAKDIRRLLEISDRHEGTMSMELYADLNTIEHKALAALEEAAHDNTN